MANCNVCVENFNKNTRKKVECPNCNYVCCSACTEKYFVSSGYEPQCMSCNRLWDMEFLHKTHNNASQKRIRELHKQKLYNAEMSLLPDTQEYAKLYRELPLLKKRNTEMYKDITAMNDRYQHNDPDNITRALWNKELASVKYDKVCCSERMHDIEQVLSGVRDTLSVGSMKSVSPIITKKEYVKKCVNESCKGFVDKSTHVCGICDTKICKDCLNELLEDHECLEDDIATAKLIMKDSKPCPECGIPIHKINGCNHMFCTQCNTPFDWRTLEIHKNGNSNPHYYQWMNESGGNQEGNQHDPCNREYEMHNLVTSKTYKSAPKEQKDKIMSFMRIFEHIYHFDNPEYLSNEILIRRNRYMRTRYLVNELSEARMKTLLMKQYKRNEFNLHMNQLASLIWDVRRDFIRKFRDSNTQEFQQVYLELDTFTKYVNTSYAHLHDIFGLQVVRAI